MKRILSFLWIILSATFVFSTVQPRLLTVADGLPNNQVRQIIELPNHQMLVATEGAFCLFNGRRFVPLECNLDSIRQLPAFGGEDHLWQGDSLLWIKDYYSLYLFDTRACKFRYDFTTHRAPQQLEQFINEPSDSLAQRKHDYLYSYVPLLDSILHGTELREDFIMAYCRDHQGGHWFGLQNSGVLYQPPATSDVRIIPLENDIPRRMVPLDSRTMIVAGIWGIYLFDTESSQFTQTLLRARLFTSEMYADHHGRIWISTNQGLYCYSNREFIHFNQSNVPGFIHDFVRFALPIDEQRVLVCNYMHNLGYLYPRQHRWQLLNNQLQQLDTYRTMIVAEPLTNRNQVAVCTQNGFFILDTRSDTLMLHPLIQQATHFSRKYNCLLLDRTGRLWAGTQNGLFYLKKKGEDYELDTQRFARLADNPWTVKCNCLFQANDGSIFVGTQNGLLRYRESNDELRRYTTREGLPHNTVLSIVDDHRGRLWMATMQGLSCLDLATDEAISFGRTDGVTDQEFVERAAVRTADGHLLFGTRQGVYTINPDSLQLPRLHLTPQLLTLHIAGQDVPITGTDSFSLPHDHNFLTFIFSTLNYAYADKYLFEFLIRSQASASKFSPENYWGAFPSFSAGWVMSEEKWWPKEKLNIGFAKLRASFGIMGRDNVEAWRWLQLYSYNSTRGPIFGTDITKTSARAFQLPEKSGTNRDLHWDTNIKTNLGLDLRMFDDRLSLSIDGYYDMGREMFAIPTANEMPGTAGTYPAPENYSEMDMYGFEIIAGWRQRINKDMYVSARLGFSYDDNKVIKTYWPRTGQRSFTSVVKGERSDRGLWGYSCLGMFRTYQEIEEYFTKYNITNYLGLSQSQVHPGMLIYEDIRGQKIEGTDDYGEKDGKIDSNDYVCISKRANNPYSSNLNLNFVYKSFSLNATLTGEWGAYTMMPNMFRESFDSMETTNVSTMWNDMFIYADVHDANGDVIAAANPNGRWPNFGYTSGSVNSQTSTFWRMPATQIYLRNITIAYTFPKSWVKSVGLNAVRFNITCQNAFSFYNACPGGYWNNFAGSYGSYPVVRKITAGLNVTF